MVGILFLILVVGFTGLHVPKASLRIDYIARISRRCRSPAKAVRAACDFGYVISPPSCDRGPTAEAVLAAGNAFYFPRVAQVAWVKQVAKSQSSVTHRHTPPNTYTTRHTQIILWHGSPFCAGG
jgi:hypothetical protein